MMNNYVTTEMVADELYFELSKSKYNDEFADYLLNDKKFNGELLAKIELHDSDKVINNKIKKQIKKYEEILVLK